jgi:D-alanine-D-alanine ligase
MLIGLTYDLRQEYLDAGYGDEETAEFDRSETIDAIDHTLRELGHETDRIGRVTSLVERLAGGDRWDLVFNIAEGLHGIGREAQVPALLDAYGIPYTFSDPLVCALTLHKATTKRIIRDLGLPTPEFAIVENEGDIGKVVQALRPGGSNPLFAKPIAEGTSKGITSASKITSDHQLATVCRRLLNEFKQPVLVETYLPGREFTVGIVGTGDVAEAIAVMEVHLLPSAEAEVYSYLNKEQCEQRVKYGLIEGPIAEEARQLAWAAWRGLGCRDAGRVDLRADSTSGGGKLHFIEVNPLPGLHPQHSDLPIMAELARISYRELIQRIIVSASKRVKPAAGGLARLEAFTT